MTMLLTPTLPHLQPLRHPWHNNGPIRQQNDKEHILDWTPLPAVRKANEPKWDWRCPKLLRLQCSDLYVVKVVIKSAAISATFSLVTLCGTFCSSLSKTYSSVPPSLTAPRYRNNSTDMAGIASKKVIKIPARQRVKPSVWTVSLGKM